jgi:hypothetical protein
MGKPKKKKKKKAIVRSIKSFWGKKIGPKSSQYEDLEKYENAIFRQVGFKHVAKI